MRRKRISRALLVAFGLAIACAGLSACISPGDLESMASRYDGTISRIDGLLQIAAPQLARLDEARSAIEEGAKAVSDRRIASGENLDKPLAWTDWALIASGVLNAVLGVMWGRDKKYVAKIMGAT